tara:strand:+ start:1935 stop:2624 length:690 start_codon:yes stop_codon:yes gene_type:complete
MKLLRVTLIVFGAVALAIGAWGPIAVKAVSSQKDQHPVRGVLQFKGEPVDLGDAAPRVGELIANVEFIDIGGNRKDLAEIMGDSGLVVVIRDVFCPVSRKYGTRLGRIEDEYRDKGFGFLYVNVNRADTLEVVRDEIDAYGFEAPYVLDPGAPIAYVLEATTSTEVFVLDASRMLRYRGAVDDQYGIGFTKVAPTKNYMVDALNAVEAGTEVEFKGTIAPGCYLSLAGG